MKKIKEWITPVGIIILVVLAGLIKADTSHMGKSHRKGATKPHTQRAERGQRMQRAVEWRKGLRSTTPPTERFKKEGVKGRGWSGKGRSAK
jgi:hypothetical protein